MHAKRKQMAHMGYYPNSNPTPTTHPTPTITPDPNLSPPPNQVGGNGEDSGNTILKLLNLLRIIRIFKVTRLYPGAALLSRALIASAPALLVPLAFLILGAAFFGAVYFFFEGLDKENTSLLPEHDVGDALWFMIVTFTTVGYGDMYPVSKLGKIVTVLAILCGVIFMAMPVRVKK